MNSTVYVFGALQNGQTQYPDDYTKQIFAHCATLATGKAQIITHRDKNLVYYCYIRHLDNDGQYIGFCILLNRALCNDIPLLFTIFEEAVQVLVIQGAIIGFDNQGNIVAQTAEIKDCQHEAEEVVAFLRAQLNTIDSTTTALPPVDNSVDNSETRTFNVEQEDAATIVAATAKYSYVRLCKKTRDDTATLTGYKQVIGALHMTIVRLTNERNRLRSDRTAAILKRVAMALLAIAVLGGGVLLFRYYTNQNLHELLAAREKISRDDSKIETLQENLDEQRQETRKWRTEAQETQEELAVIRPLRNYMPLIIEDIQMGNIYKGGTIETDYGNTIYSSRTMYLNPKISYRGIRPGKIDLYIKIYTPSGVMSTGTSSPEGYTTKYKIDVSSGNDNTATFSGWGNETKGYWSSGTYRIEIWYGGICLKAKYFTIAYG